MGLTNAACDFHATNMVGNSVTLFDEVNAALGVGNDNTAFAASQTKLMAEVYGSGAIRKGMDFDYPIRNPDNDGSTNKLRYQATFGQSEANFQWQEWGLFNSVTSGDGTMHNREVEYIGEKTNKATWVFQVDISLVT